MIRFQRLSPHIYVLIFERFLYIGETQREPPARWAEHFGRNGSFVNALERVGVTEKDLISDTFIAEAFSCPGILELDKVLRKAATQEVEDILHRKVRTSKSLYSFRIISNTIKTAPREPVWSGSEELADVILLELENSLRSF